jgi:hypothetical protein
MGQPLRERFGVLGALNMTRCIKGYSNVLSLDIVPSESFTQHELPAILETTLVDGHIKKILASVQEAMYSLVAPRELLTVTSGYRASCLFYTDGSLIEFQMGVAGFEYKILSPTGVFTADLSLLS